MRQHMSVHPANPRSPSSDPPPTGPSPSTGPPPRRRSVAVVVVAVVGGLALGIGLTLAFTGNGDQASEPVDTVPVTPPVAADDNGTGAATSAATPRAAVEGFLGAEIDGDLAASFGFLSAEARSGFGSPAGWVAAHPDILPPVTGYEVREADEPSGEVDRAQVVTEVRFVPGLDEVRGLVTERATVTWATVTDDGSWSIDLASTTVEPIYLSDESASAAVVTWAEAHQACEPAPTWGGSLRGSPALAERLCGQEGQVEVQPPSPLTSVDSGPFLAAFGPRVGDWARVVAVTAPVELRAVVAPIGQEWLVIGVLPA